MHPDSPITRIAGLVGRLTATESGASQTRSNSAIPRVVAARAALAILTAVALIAVAAWSWSTRPADTSLAHFRTEFDPGEAGWAAYRALAYNSDQALGPALSVQVLMLRTDRPEPAMYFIPSAGNPLHYEFAHQVVRTEAFAFTRQTFDWATYLRPDRTQLAAELVWYPDYAAPGEAGQAPVTAPVIMQFAAAFQPNVTDIATAYRSISAHMPMLGSSGAARQLYYLPAGPEQEDTARANAAALAAAGVAWLPEDTLFRRMRFQALNAGVSFGLLRVVEGGIPANADGPASASFMEEGSVSYRDILILDRLPLDLPLVGGTITEERQTPLAHVNVLAKTRGTPNMALVDARHDPRLSGLVGKLVRFAVTPGGFDVREATEAQVEAFWQDRRPNTTAILKADLSVRGIRDLDDLSFADRVTVGAKAANLAELHHLLPDIAPGGLAVPFAVYDTHLRRWTVSTADCKSWSAACSEDLPPASCERAAATCESVVAERAPGTLRDYIGVLLDRPDFRTDSLLRAALLHGIRTAIATGPLDPSFAADLQKSTLAAFDTRPFRLRSSTNSEDLAGFTGAGLYDSVTAYAVGDEKPVADRIGRVWASVWNWTAFEERAWWGIPHLDVSMAVLINRAFPEEHANGVLITRNLANPDQPGLYVNAQLGETSVTNPTTDAFPEVLTLTQTWHGWQARTLQYASQSLDASVLTAAEAAALADAATRAHRHFAALYGQPTDSAAADRAAFELEFKIHDTPRHLYIKQIRPFASTTETSASAATATSTSLRP